LRTRASGLPQNFRAPFYPVVPLLFCLSSAYMFCEAVPYAVKHAPWGLVASCIVLGIGALLAFLERAR
jgi:APA family basic amino acid/polyamine antiporter